MVVVAGSLVLVSVVPEMVKTSGHVDVDVEPRLSMRSGKEIL